MLLAPDSPLADFFESRQAGPPAHLGRRYDKAGVFQPEPGNTVVCHLVAGTQTERALVEAREKYLAMPEAGHLAFTPVSSLHMTLFQGIIEYRRKPGYWPPAITLDAPIDEMTELMGAELDGFPPQPAFDVSVVRATPTGLEVAGATDADRLAMQAWRDALANRWGYRHPDHSSYAFHITFAYMIDWLPDAALPRWQAMLDGVADDIRRRAPVLALKPPAFCAFNDMNHFEELKVLPVAG